MAVRIIVGMTKRRKQEEADHKVLIWVGHVQRGLYHIVGKVVVQHHGELVLVHNVGNQPPADVWLSHPNALQKGKG